MLSKQKLSVEKVESIYLYQLASRKCLEFTICPEQNIKPV